MSIFDLLTYFNVHDVQDQQRNQMALNEFRERADTIARQTGVTPVGFFAFEKASPTPPADNRGAKTWGGVIGALIGVSLLFGPLTPAIGVIGALAVTVLGGAVVGNLVGASIPERESSRLDRALARYDSYLTQVETTAKSSAYSRVMEAAGPAIRTNHAEKIDAERAQQQGAALSVA